MKNKIPLEQPKQLTHEDFEIYIQSLIDKYIPILMIQRHTVEIKSGTKSDTAYFEFNYNYPYLNQTICYSDKAFKEWAEGKDAEPYILHELCHTLTDPLYSKAVDRYIGKNEVEDERERLTDHICSIILKLTKDAKTPNK